MKRAAILAFALLAPAAVAKAAEPATIILPSPLIVEMNRYLASRPYAEVAPLIGAMQACIAVQIPNANGAIVSHGECQPVTDAIVERDRAAAKSAEKPVAHKAPAH